MCELSRNLSRYQTDEGLKVGIPVVAAISQGTSLNSLHRIGVKAISLVPFLIDGLGVALGSGYR